MIRSQIGEGVPNLCKRIPIVARQVTALIKLPEQRSHGSFTPITRCVGSRNPVIEIETINITAVRSAGIAPDRVVSDDRGKEVCPTFGPGDARIENVSNVRLAAGRIVTREFR